MNIEHMTCADSDEKVGNESRLHTHVKYLDDFFDAYVQNVRALQGRLNRKFPDGQGKAESCRFSTGDLTYCSAGIIAEYVGIENKTYDALMQQFNMQLIIVRVVFFAQPSWCL